MMKKHLIPLAALSVLGMANVANAARNEHMQNQCAPEPGVPCYADQCKSCYCLGPENYGVNAPVCPLTCNGDLWIEVAGFYWNAHQDGMEFAIDNHVRNPGVSPKNIADIQVLNTLVDADYINPDFKWEFGFKLGAGYCNPCDGWDFRVLWTWYQGRANKHEEAELDDNHTLLVLWSDFAPGQGSVLYATDIEQKWHLDLNLIDLELGRDFWTSRYLSIRPFVGIRIAFIEQDFDLEHRGGSWTSNTNAGQDMSFNNFVYLDNDFKGAGLRSGLDSTWNFGCGWALFGNFAASLVYGRFNVDVDEYNTDAESPHAKTRILETEDSFHATRGILDLALGIQWAGMVCDCKYGFMIGLAWEHHMFFNQNQLWRTTRIGDGFAQGFPNPTGENIYQQRRGDLDTQGWTLKARFTF